MDRVPGEGILDAKMEGNLLPGLNSQKEEVWIQDVTGMTEESERRLFELDADLGYPFREALPRPDIERHPGPAPVIDMELGGNEGWSIRIFRNIFFFPVTRNRLAPDSSRPVLAPDRESVYILTIHPPDRTEDLNLLIPDIVGRKTHWRLHGNQGDQLEHVILDNIPDHTRLFVEISPVFDPEIFRHRDLDIVDVASVPERLEDGVGEPEEDNILDCLLPQIVIDAVYLALIESCPDCTAESLR
jgi:hypothetical protein